MIECGSLTNAMARTFNQIQGVANVAFLRDDLNILGLATNNGSLFWVAFSEVGLFCFASEKLILHRFIEQTKTIRRTSGQTSIQPLASGLGLIVDLATLERSETTLAQSCDEAPKSFKQTVRSIYRPEDELKDLKRCSRCLLPLSFPLISFDEKGVCNHCRNYAPRTLKGRDAIFTLCDRLRSKDNSPDCVVALSGGRDSCYTLHFMVREMGMHPVAVTYDWGMVTDLARRNQSRLCAALEVDHVIRSPDIPTKRRHIRRNVEAWLHKPDMGMIPLFMAGDKQYFKYPLSVAQEMGLDLVVYGDGSEFERTDFKAGLAGVSQSGQRIYSYNFSNKIRLAFYYFSRVLQNPFYINSSLFDSIDGFISTFITKKNFISLFDYIPWDEDEIHRVLKKEYEWEIAPDTSSTWRIGDGTVAFYNYIYCTVAGFTEHDTFRSHQIRAGLISRDQALRLLEEDNQPRFAAMREYASLVGFNLDEALMVINAMPKLY